LKERNPLAWLTIATLNSLQLPAMTVHITSTLAHVGVQLPEVRAALPTTAVHIQSSHLFSICWRISPLQLCRQLCASQPEREAGPPASDPLSPIASAFSPPTFHSPSSASLPRPASTPPVNACRCQSSQAAEPFSRTFPLNSKTTQLYYPATHSTAATLVLCADLRQCSRKFRVTLEL
jgi:hypothetical protein